VSCREARKDLGRFSTTESDLKAKYVLGICPLHLTHPS